MNLTKLNKLVLFFKGGGKIDLSGTVKRLKGVDIGDVGGNDDKEDSDAIFYLKINYADVKVSYTDTGVYFGPLFKNVFTFGDVGGIILRSQTGQALIFNSIINKAGNKSISSAVDKTIIYGKKEAIQRFIENFKDDIEYTTNVE